MDRCHAVARIDSGVRTAPPRLPTLLTAAVGLHPVLFSAAGRAGAAGLSANDYRALAGAVDPRAARDFGELILHLRGLPAYALQERVLSAVLRDSAAVNRLLAGETDLARALACANELDDVPPPARVRAELLARLVERPGEVRAQLLAGLSETWQRHGERWNRSLPAMQRARTRLERTCSEALRKRLPFDASSGQLIWESGHRLPLDRTDGIALMPSVLAGGGEWHAFPTAASKWRFAVPFAVDPIE